jgi:hypothetical protein
MPCCCDKNGLGVYYLFKLDGFLVEVNRWYDAWKKATTLETHGYREVLKQSADRRSKFDWQTFDWICDEDFIDTRSYSYLRNRMRDGFRLKNSFELVTKKSKQTTNIDIPDTKELNEMGVSGWWDRNRLWPNLDPSSPPYRKNPWLDHKDMDDRDFRERCIQVAGMLYVLYPQGLPELSAPYHQRKEGIETWVDQECRNPDCNCHSKLKGIDKLDADSIAKAFKRFGMDWNRVIKIMFGFHAEDGDWRPGLHVLDAEDLESIANIFEELADQIEEPVSELESQRQFYYDLSNRFLSEKYENKPFKTVLGQLDYIEKMSALAVIEAGEEKPDPRDVDFLIEYGFSESEEFGESEDQQYEDPAYDDPKTDGWTAFGLHYGEDTVKFHWTACVRTAGVKRLQAWKRLMGKLWYITWQQKSDLWRRIWARQEQLISQIESKLTRQVRLILKEMKSLSLKETVALIYSYQNGGKFCRYNDFNFNDVKGDPEMVFYLWNTYRERKKNEAALL